MRRIERVYVDASATTRATVGYVPTYRVGFSNFCPGCGGAHWHVGRTTAECAWCATALPIAAMTYDRPAPLHVAPSGWRALLRAA